MRWARRGLRTVLRATLALLMGRRWRGQRRPSKREHLSMSHEWSLDSLMNMDYGQLPGEQLRLGDANVFVMLRCCWAIALSPLAWQTCRLVCILRFAQGVEPSRPKNTEFHPLHIETVGLGSTMVFQCIFVTGLVIERTLAMFSAVFVTNLVEIFSAGQVQEPRSSRRGGTNRSSEQFAGLDVNCLNLYRFCKCWHICNVEDSFILGRRLRIAFAFSFDSCGGGGTTKQSDSHTRSRCSEYLVAR